MPVAEEAHATASFLGSRVEAVNDVGAVQLADGPRAMRFKRTH